MTSSLSHALAAGQATSPLSDFLVVHSYSRAQAIQDGVLMDLSAVAPDVCAQHYRHPVACTAAVWAIVEKAVANKRWMNDLNGIIHDILWMSRCYKGEGSEKLFRVIIKGAGRRSTFTLKLHCGPGDRGAPVLTVMMPDED